MGGGKKAGKKAGKKHTALKKIAKVLKKRFGKKKMMMVGKFGGFKALVKHLKFAGKKAGKKAGLRKFAGKLKKGGKKAGKKAGKKFFHIVAKVVGKKARKALKHLKKVVKHLIAKHK